MRRHHLLFATATAALLALSSPALAQQVTPAQEQEGRAHFERGLGLFQSQDFNGALAEFQAAYEIGRRPNVLYNIGVTQQALHHYPEAARAIEQYLREANPPADRRAQVETGLREIQQYIGHVNLTGLPNGAVISVDGDRVGTTPLAAPLAVGTGRHVIEVQADGYIDGRETVTVAGGQNRDVHFTLRPVGTGPALPTATGGTALLIRGVPDSATVLIDGRVATVGQPAQVTAGVHTVRITAQGFSPYEGQVEVPANVQRLATVHLVSAGGLSPIPLVIVGSATVVLGVIGIVMGAVTQSTYSMFMTRDQSSPDAQMLSDQGNTQQIVANTMFGLAGVAAVGAAILASQTRFSSGNATVDVAFAPRPGGGLQGGLTIHF
jgi:hypothetical protein